MWAIAYQFDTTSDGRTLKLCNIVDMFTREALSVTVGRSCDADATVTLLDNLSRHRGAPVFIRCDNGPELTSAPLRDWGRFNNTYLLH